MERGEGRPSIVQEGPAKLSSDRETMFLGNYASFLKTAAKVLIESTAKTKINKQPRMAGTIYTFS
jgi:hypothetical protein